MGDIHGYNYALLQCLERAGFDYENDRLIQLGDVSDRGPDTAQSVETLMRIRNLVAIRGNHDCWTHDFFMNEEAPNLWLGQGGYETIQSYRRLSNKRYGRIRNQVMHDELHDRHKEFYQGQVDWYIDEVNRLFIHGGWDYKTHPDDFERAAGERIPDGGRMSRNCHWDRSLFYGCEDGKKKAIRAAAQFSEVYIGHTPHEIRPYYQIGNLFNLDTGAARGNEITMVNVETKEVFASDPVSVLYS